MAPLVLTTQIRASKNSVLHVACGMNNAHAMTTTCGDDDDDDVICTPIYGSRVFDTRIQHETPGANESSIDEIGDQCIE